MTSILVLEDEQALLENVLQTLEMEGFEVLEAGDGLTGLQIAREQLPDLILCDIAMPGLDGFEVLAALQSNITTATIPFIFLTARASREDLRRGMELGADDYLTKPFAPHELLAAVRTRLDKQTSHEIRQLRIFANKLVMMQELDRRHLAQELQNEVGHMLSGLKLMLSLSEQMSPDLIQSTIADARTQINQTLNRLNDHLLNLWPEALDRLGLLPALIWLFQRYTAQTRIHVDFQQTQLDRNFSEEVKTAAYRIVQEALANVAQHAQIDRVLVRGWVEDNVLNIQIIDEGVGFHLPKAISQDTAIGLIGIRERVTAVGGNLSIVTAPQDGTQIFIVIPLKEDLPGISVNQPWPSSIPTETTRHLSMPANADKLNELMVNQRSVFSARNDENTITIGLAVANDIMRYGLKNLFSFDGDFKVVGETATGREVIHLVEQTTPNVLVLDISVGSEVNIVNITQHLAEYSPQTKILVLSSYSEEAYFLEAFRSGATGYVLRNTDADTLVEAIREVNAGHRYLGPDLSDQLVETYIDLKQLEAEPHLDAYSTLTNREREVLHLVLEGYTNMQIAEQLVISHRTVEIHRSNMMHKLGVKNKIELIRYAVRRNILPADQ